jgi:phosphoribosyl 1,2-cyclic phosphodiesterase
LRLIFLGTRGEIDERTRLHRMHASLLVSWRRKAIMIDCGADWAGQLGRVRPDAILLTHAHPDHAWGLKPGAPCPVYATAETWSRIRAGPVPEAIVIEPASPVRVCGMRVEAFEVEHSIRAPAVGYRISAGRGSLFYAPDVLRIHDPERALGGAGLYVGDGASILRSIVRKRGSARFGHASIRAQLGWCQGQRVPRAIFSHCGSQIVTADPRLIENQIRALGLQAGVKASLAHDGLRLVV